MIQVYGPGTFAYFDSFGGLVPCKVVEVFDQVCKIKITATRGAYKRGEKIYRMHSRVVPRNHVRKKRIVGGYVWRNPN